MTAEIIAELEAGHLRCVQPWTAEPLGGSDPSGDLSDLNARNQLDLFLKRES
ncbi:hypothetical protein ABC974_11950 [Sphingomonas oligophenolica]|uniref:Uncharacterized protein n=1 Tax=Sphingomonas oligophenolica TaxID=301154 RepID=A0ABU9Y3F0_9SPHN